MATAKKTTAKKTTTAKKPATTAKKTTTARKTTTAKKTTATKKVNNVDVGTKFEIQLRFTDPDIKGKGKIVKTIERASFADSLELAEAWLNRHNAQK